MQRIGPIEEHLPAEWQRPGRQAVLGCQGTGRPQRSTKQGLLGLRIPIDQDVGTECIARPLRAPGRDERDGAKHTMCVFSIAGRMLGTSTSHQ